MSTLSLENIMEFLAASSGEKLPETDVGSPEDIPFPLLGYDSLAVLKTVGHIERTYRIELPEAVLNVVKTPRQLLDRVNTELVRARSR